MLTSSAIFFEFKYSTLVSDLYGLIRLLLYIIFVKPYCNFTVPLVKNPPSPGFLHGDCTRNHTVQRIGPTKSMSDKKA